VQEQEAREEDGQELAGGHDGGEDERAKGLDRVADEECACVGWGRGAGHLREGQAVLQGARRVRRERA